MVRKTAKKGWTRRCSFCSSWESMARVRRTSSADKPQRYLPSSSLENVQPALPSVQRRAGDSVGLSLAWIEKPVSRRKRSSDIRESVCKDIKKKITRDRCQSVLVTAARANASANLFE